MNKEEIEEIEKRFPPEGLTGFLFHLLCCDDYDNLAVNEVFPDGSVGMAMKGSGPISSAVFGV